MDVQKKKIKDDARNQTNKVYSLLKQVSVSLSRSSLTKPKIMEGQTNLFLANSFSGGPDWPPIWRLLLHRFWFLLRNRQIPIFIVSLLTKHETNIAMCVCVCGWLMSWWQEETHAVLHEWPTIARTKHQNCFCLPNYFLCKQEQPIFKFWWLQHGAWGKFLPSSLTATRPSLCSRYVAVVFWLTLIVYCILIVYYININK